MIKFTLKKKKRKKKLHSDSKIFFRRYKIVENPNFKYLPLKFMQFEISFVSILIYNFKIVYINCYKQVFFSNRFSFNKLVVKALTK